MFKPIKIIKTGSYPKIYEAFNRVCTDNDVPCDHPTPIEGHVCFFEIPDKHADPVNLAIINLQFAGLTDLEFDTLCTGEQDDALAIVERYNIKECHDFLNLWFSGWEN